MSKVVFLDLLEVGGRILNEHCDVCVVGAGAAGIYLAVQLAKKGIDVVLVEAGGAICCNNSQIGFEATFSEEFYPGATEGRFFGLGGSTSRWGGLLIPHTKRDLLQLDQTGSNPWQKIISTVSEKSEIVLRNLGYEYGGGFESFARELLRGTWEQLNNSGFDVTASLYLPLRFKNLAVLLSGRETFLSRIRVFLNAVAKSWIMEDGVSDDGQRVKCLSAVARNGRSLNVKANCFVVAAGAIESARILLEIDDSVPTPIIRSNAVGCYLSDHLSTPIADVDTDSLESATRLFAPRFSHGWMRAFRFIESSPPPDAPRAFAHFIFENENQGFILAKKILGAFQSRRKPKVSCSEVLSGIGGLFALAYYRYWRSVLYIPSATKAHLQLDIEQQPVRENRITLGFERDRYGRRITNIRWRISNDDIENIKTTAQRILKRWVGTRRGLPELVPRCVDCDSAKPYDAYHPVGTCRMGNDPEAVVDEKLKVRGVTNLWVLSTGVLPSAGAANPTFTTLCLAEEIAEHLAVIPR